MASRRNSLSKGVKGIDRVVCRKVERAQTLVLLVQSMWQTVEEPNLERKEGAGPVGPLA